MQPLTWMDIAAVAVSLAIIVLVSYLVDLVKRVSAALSEVHSALLPQIQSVLIALEKAADAHARVADAVEALIDNDVSVIVGNLNKVSSDLR
ncbi:MAG: hypothetical protein ACP5J5_04430, partial [Dissulfurimicrobium sp.]